MPLIYTNICYLSIGMVSPRILYESLISAGLRIFVLEGRQSYLEIKRVFHCCLTVFWTSSHFATRQLRPRTRVGCELVSSVSYNLRSKYLLTVKIAYA